MAEPRVHRFEIRLNKTAGAFDMYSIALNEIGNSSFRELAVLTDCPLPKLSDLRFRFHQPLQEFCSANISTELVEKIGSDLAEVILPPKIRDKIKAELARPQKGARIAALLQISLRFEDLPELEYLPWEFVRADLSPQFADFLSLKKGFALSRTVATDTPSGELAAATRVPPLRLLLVTADPQTAEYPVLPHLSEEVDGIKHVFDSSRNRGTVAMDTLPFATPDQLRHRLSSGPSPNIIHLAMHGDERPTGGCLIFQGAGPRSARSVYGAELARLLNQCGSELRLVVLSGCRTSVIGAELAKTLSARGALTVIGMQLPMRDSSARMFSKVLYDGILEGCAIDQALRLARQSIHAYGPDWGVPVLYQNGDSEPLYRISQRLGASNSPRKSANSRVARVMHLPSQQPHADVGSDARVADLKRRLELSARTPASIALVGISGVGKSHLALEFGYRRSMDYPGGVFWFNSYDSEQLRTEIASVGREYFQVADDLPSTMSVTQTHKELARSRKRSLLIFDNVSEYTDLKLFPAAGNFHVIVTAKSSKVVGENFPVYLMKPVEESEALQFLLKTDARDYSKDEIAASKSIADLLGKLPIALVVVRRHMTRLDLTFTEYSQRLVSNPLEQLKKAAGRSSATSASDLSISDAFDIAVRSVSEDAKRILQATTCLAPKNIPDSLLFEASLLASFEDFEEGVADLVEFCLLMRDGGHRVSVHELVRQFMIKQTPAEDAKEMASRLAGKMTEMLRQANSAMDWNPVRNDIVQFNAAAKTCRDHNLRRELSGLLHALAIYQLHHAELAQAETLLNEALGIVREDQSEGEPIAPLLMTQGEIESGNDRHQSAVKLFIRALRACRKTYGTNSAETADYLNCLGVALKKSRRPKMASAFYMCALHLYRKQASADKIPLVECLINIGVLHEQNQEFSQALVYMQEALEIIEKAYGPNHVRVAVALNSIGRVKASQQEYEVARKLHQRAHDIYAAAYHAKHPDIASSLYYLGHAALSMGDIVAAKLAFEQSLSLYMQFYSADNSRCQMVAAELEKIASA